jgi:hypothetical protein
MEVDEASSEVPAVIEGLPGGDDTEMADPDVELVLEYRPAIESVASSSSLSMGEAVPAVNAVSLATPVMGEAIMTSTLNARKRKEASPGMSTASACPRSDTDPAHRPARAGPLWHP